MKIAIPVERDKGMESIVYGHFGSAPFFLIYDTDSTQISVIDNSNKEHSHGHCMPASELIDMGVKSVICNGMGARAIDKLNAVGISVMFAPSAQTANQIIGALDDGVLNELSKEDACQHHDCH